MNYNFLTFQNFALLIALGQTFIAIVNFLTKPILKKTKSINDLLVSILIPARNEEKNILTLLNSIKNQDYQNIEVIVLDDNSTDNTFNLVNNFCETYNKFHIIQGQELPKNWLGKNWACYQLSLKAKGDFIIFLDSDTVIFPDLINSTLNYAKEKKLSLLSIFPDQITITNSEKIIVPFINYVLLTLLPLQLVRFPYFSSISAANGQFMMFEKENYKKNNWHELVKNNIAEDVTIVRKMKTNKDKVAVLLSNGLIKCRMYNNLDECIKGFEKNILLIFGNSIIFLVFYLIFCLFNIFLFSSKNYFIISLISILISKMLVSILSNQNVLMNILFYPLQIFFVTIIALKAIYKKITKKEVSWKERNIILEK
ncbi:MAG: glycosyltransferase family 2 protein [Cyanobacteriota bacterium]